MSHNLVSAKECVRILDKRSNCQPQAGFTLLELVVGITLLALITTLLVNVLGTGIAATKQVDRRAQRIEQAYHVHRLLRAGLETTRPLGWNTDGRLRPLFAGGTSVMKFVTIAPPWPGLGGLVLAHLYLDDGQLVLAEQTFIGDGTGAGGPGAGRLGGPPGAAFGAGIAGTGEILARDIGTLRIGYFGRVGRQRAAWHHAWTERRLPSRIRVRIAWRDGEQWPDLIVHPRLGPQPR